MYSHETDDQLKPSDEDHSKRGAVVPYELTAKLAPLCVADAMTKDLVTLSPDLTFAEVVGLMAKYTFRHFLVIDSSRRLIGVISDRDVLRALARTRNWQATYARDLMSCNVVTVKPTTELSVAAGTMLEKRVNCLPVVDDNGDTCGIITSTDLLKSFREIQGRLEKENKLARR